MSKTYRNCFDITLWYRKNYKGTVIFSVDANSIDEALQAYKENPSYDSSRVDPINVLITPLNVTKKRKLKFTFSDKPTTKENLCILL